MLKFSGNTQWGQIKSSEDKQSDMAKGSTKPKDASRYIDMRYHYRKEVFRNDEVYLYYVHGGMQVADISTKYTTWDK